MKMYVANCTRQVLAFFYRLPETNGARSQKIEVGQQIQISGDLNPLQIDEVVKQNAKYGLIREDEVNKTKPFIGMCYQIDKPIKINSVILALEHNTEVLVDKGKEIRKEAAVVINEALAAEHPDHLKTQISVVEEDKNDGHDPTFAEGYEVSGKGAGRQSELRPNRGSRRKNR